MKHLNKKMCLGITNSSHAKLTKILSRFLTASRCLNNLKATLIVNIITQNLIIVEALGQTSDSHPKLVFQSGI
jgi:hypothetical protein